MAKEMSLEAMVKGYWTGRDKNSARGLALLDQCITRFAQHGDWDHLSRFVVSAIKVGQGPAVKRIIRVAFGNHVTFSPDSKHATGGKFVKVMWPGVSFPLAERNAYSIITKAVEQGMGWDSRAFQKALDDVLPKADKPAKKVDAATQTKEAKALAVKLKALREAGFDLASVVREAQSILAANPAPNSDGSVKNGEPTF